MQDLGKLWRWLTGQCFVCSFGGGGGAPRPAAPKAVAPAPAAIAPPKETTAPVATFNPEQERKGVTNRTNFILGSAIPGRKMGQQTILGAGL